MTLPSKSNTCKFQYGRFTAEIHYLHIQLLANSYTPPYHHKPDQIFHTPRIEAHKNLFLNSLFIIKLNVRRLQAKWHRKLSAKCLTFFGNILISLLLASSSLYLFNVCWPLHQQKVICGNICVMSIIYFTKLFRNFIFNVYCFIFICNSPMQVVTTIKILITVT